MALAEPTGGAGRSTLIDALSKLRQRYAGLPGLPEERAATGATYESPVAPGPPSTYTPPDNTLGGFFPGLSTASAPPPPGATASDPWGYGDTGWGANGVNLYNPLLARGDMAAPGPVGRGPGFWTLDNFGTPFWRSDWDHFDPVQGKWLIKGEN